MTTDVPAATLDTQQRLDQRLDAIDRTLLGLLPRHERMEIVAKIELRVRERAALDASVAAILHEASPASDPLVGAARTTVKRRSRLALTAGVLGIVSIGLLLASPVTFILVELLSDMMGEFVSFSMLSMHALAATFAGALAVIFGLVAIIRLARSQRERVGHGWAITGLCTGPFPALAGALLVLFIGGQVLSEGLMTVSVGQSPPATLVSAGPPSACATCDVCCIPPLPAETVAYAAPPVALAPPSLPAAVIGSVAATPSPIPPANDAANFQVPLAESRSSLPATDEQPTLTTAPPVSTLSLPPAVVAPSAEPAPEPTETTAH